MKKKYVYTPKRDQHQRKLAYEILKIMHVNVTAKRMSELRDLMTRFEFEDKKSESLLTEK